MGSIDVHRSWLESPTALPLVCLLTGEPSQGNTLKKAVRLSPNVGGGAAAGIAGAAGVGVLLVPVGERVSLYLPMSHRGASRERLWKWGVIAAAAVGFVLLASTADNLDTTGRNASLVVMIMAAGVYMWRRLRGGVGVRMTAKSPTVRLTRVHPAAVTAIKSHIEANTPAASPAPLPWG
jgi:hypothetical protein